MTLVQRIERELLRLLAARQPLPFKLTLTGIARHFKVSPMPVRQAVQQLVDTGILEKSDSGRLTVNQDNLPDHVALTDEPVGQAEQGVHDRLTADIIRRSLAHDEHYLREAATAEQFGVGRTVVRRVFSELAGRGLLEHVPRCGWLVRPYREKDTIDYLAVRELLERRALELAFDQLDPKLLREIRDANTLSHDGEPAELDNRMHAYWVRLCGNRYIQSFFDREGDYYAAIFDYAALDPAATDRMANQHRAILDALLDRDLPRALDALSQHIRDQRANVTRMIERHQSGSRKG